MGIYPPFSQNRYNCETFLKSVAFYTMKANMDPAIDKEIRVMDDKSDGPPGMRQKVDALVESRDRGKKPSHRAKIPSRAKLSLNFIT